jgi:hypothetical protein
LFIELKREARHAGPFSFADIFPRRLVLQLFSGGTVVKMALTDPCRADIDMHGKDSSSQLACPFTGPKGSLANHRQAIQKRIRFRNGDKVMRLA